MKKQPLVLSLSAAVLLAGLALLASGLWPVVPAQASPGLQGANVLPNPGFEDPYSDGVAANWAPWHKDTGSKLDCDTQTYYARPKWVRETNTADSFVYDGFISQHVGNQFDTWRAGVFQTVTVTPGARYRFSFYGRVRSSNDQVPVPSDGGAGLVRAGIDPNGTGLWSDADIVWSGSIAPHDTWQQVSVEATAATDKISVFVEADFAGPNHCRAHLDAWFDKGELVAVTTTPPVDAGGQPTTPPTAPPAPVVVVTPGPTPTPDAEGNIYLAVPPGGSLWTVASLAGISLDELLALNNMTRDDFVRVGQLLLVAHVEAQPTATATPLPEEAATEAPEATPTPEPTQAPANAGIICVNAFGDSNADGQHEPAEGFMAGVSFELSQNASVLSQGISRGTDEPLCFENIAAGPYKVTQKLPSSLEPTTATEMSLDLGEGEQVGLEFGSRVRQVAEETAVADAGSNAPAATAVPAPAQTGAAQGPSLVAIGGLILLFLAVILLGALIFIVLRQRT